MNLIVDFHIHSRYSRATSKSLDLENIYKWGKIKGIDVVGTGDFTHPIWFKELREKLVEKEQGLYTLRREFADLIDKELPESVRDREMRFLLSVEISNIYKRDDKVRKMHNVLLAPDFKTASKIINELDKIGNLKSDGRPILGMDSRDLLQLTLDIASNSFYFPAHIWTPWFSLFGSKSGFDSLEEAYGNLAKYIKVAETGLSSDPFMNWRWSELDNITMVSSSDAHSPQKLGREANVINCELNYNSILDSIKTGDKRFVGTIEFFPEEGMYHYDGHRKCNICFAPSESIKHNLECPKCHKPLVLGVDYRIKELADRDEDFKPKKHKKVEYIIPLPEIIAEIENIKNVNSKTVQDKYFKIINEFGNEFNILRTVSIDEFHKAGYDQIAEAIQRLRKGDVHVEPGFDGVYGKISVFGNEEEKKRSIGQVSMFN